MIMKLFHFVGIISLIKLHIYAQDDCPFAGFDKHELEIYETYPYSLINASTAGLYPNQSEYGVEGGQIFLINNTFYLFITEFTGDPYFVPSNLALWSTTMSRFPFGWKRIKTLYKSGGVCDCNNTKASLGSSITAYYDEINTKWLLYYVGFISCNNDSYFVNRDGRIFLAESTVLGINGIIGPYKDIDVILKPDNNSETQWEGLQGVDSFSNPYLVGNTYYAFYGSALTQDSPPGNQRVGLVTSSSLYGPWIREPYPSINPVSLEIPNNHTEQPIIIRYYDDTYGAVFDALDHESAGQIGYNWSPDGKTWNGNCSQMLTVNPQNGIHWGHQARTPQGLIPINNTHFYVFFSGRDAVPNNKHESFGFAKARFKV